MLDARFSHLYFYQSLNRLQRGLSAIAELLVETELIIRDTMRSVTRQSVAKFLFIDKSLPLQRLKRGTIGAEGFEQPGCPCVCESVCECECVCSPSYLPNDYTKLITVIRQQIHMTLVTRKRSLGQRSRSTRDGYSSGEFNRC